MSNVKNFDETWIKGDRLGKGGQGTTYKCSKKDSPQVIGALKTLNNQKDMERRRRMQREVTSLTTLAHLGYLKSMTSTPKTGRIQSITCYGF